MNIRNNNILYFQKYLSRLSCSIKELEDRIEECCSGGSSNDDQNTDEIFSTEAIVIGGVSYPVGSSLQLLLEALSVYAVSGGLPARPIVPIYDAFNVFQFDAFYP